MLKVKLARFGKKHQPHYRIVITEARDKRDGYYVESIGHYAPSSQPKVLTVDVEKYDAWLKKGAQPTDTVRSIVERFRSGKPFEVKKTLSKKAKAKQDAPKVEEEVKTEEKPVEVAAEAPAENTSNQEATA